MTKFFKVISLFAGLSFAVGAAADGDVLDSEYLHQTGAGVFELIPGIGQAPGQTAWTNQDPGGIMFGSATARATSTKITSTVVPVVVAVEYGINSMFSVGGDLSYGSGSQTCSGCTSQSQKGLYNPVLYFKGRSAVGGGTLQYGVIADVGIEKDKTTSSNRTNFATGGTTLTPFVAYQMAAGPGIWGARLQYDVVKTDMKATDSTSTPSDSTSTGGNAFVIDTFYEAPVGGFTLGAAVFYNMSAETKTAVGGGASTSNSDAYKMLGVEVYAPVKVGSVTILPNVAYENVSYSSSQSGLSALSGFQVGAAARLTF